jgi:hypothetical protein
VIVSRVAQKQDIKNDYGRVRAFSQRCLSYSSDKNTTKALENK